MPTFQCFEDLPVFISARELTIQIYEITCGSDFRKDFGLRDQIRRAAISVMSNIAEGFEHETQAQFISYLGRSKASAGEIRCQLYIAFDLSYISDNQLHETMALTKKCSKQLYGFIRYLRSLPNSPRVK